MVPLFAIEGDVFMFKICSKPLGATRKNVSMWQGLRTCFPSASPFLPGRELLSRKGGDRQAQIGRDFSEGFQRPRGQ